MLNRGYAYTTIIGSKDYGRTLRSHLASLYPHSTSQAWQQNLNNGEVTLNGVTATGSESLTVGQTLVWNRPPWIEPDAPQHFEVLFEDAHLLAVNKPSGLPTLPGGGYLENTLLRLVQRQFPSANPVHRLGRATTGIVLFAQTPQAAATLTAKRCTARRLRNHHPHRPRTAPTARLRVGRQPSGQTVEVAGEGDRTHSLHCDSCSHDNV
jgi:23S rRNA pseudouridine1911/1915/1917 synthase